MIMYNMNMLMLYMLYTIMLCIFMLHTVMLHML